MTTDRTLIGEVLDGFRSSHLQPSGCRGAHTERCAESLAERSR